MVLTIFSVYYTYCNVCKQGTFRSPASRTVAPFCAATITASWMSPSGQLPYCAIIVELLLYCACSVYAVCNLYLLHMILFIDYSFTVYTYIYRYIHCIYIHYIYTYIPYTHIDILLTRTSL